MDRQLPNLRWVRGQPEALPVPAAAKVLHLPRVGADDLVLQDVRMPSSSAARSAYAGRGGTCR